MLNRKTVLAAWQAFLGRVPDEESIPGYQLCANHNELLILLSGTEEFQRRLSMGYVTHSHAISMFTSMCGPAIEPSRADIVDYVVPRALSRTPDPARKVLLIGGCLFADWGPVISARFPGTIAQHALFFNGGDISSQLSHKIEEFDCLLVQIPLRAILPDHEMFERSYADIDGYRNSFVRCVERLSTLLGEALAHAGDRPVFVLNYPLPQMSGLGRLLPRYDLRNPTFLIEELNRALAGIIADHPSVHLLDIDQLAGTIGRRYVQDDAFWVFSHGSVINDYDYNTDGQRLDPHQPLSQRYKFEIDSFIAAAWAEVNAALRTIAGTDIIKMVCVDLDDTLWRGVPAEADILDQHTVEGWPLGVVEALLMLKRRGVILAVTSKNDEKRVEALMKELFRARLSLGDFAIRKINWLPKTSNIREALAEANVLPNSVIFIDDNPVERAAVAQDFPEIRILGPAHTDWRRILLWSAETQVAHISAESARRTEMIVAQGHRETERKTQSHEAFVAGLGLEVKISILESIDGRGFERAFELLNKTNQFNTTGRRWDLAEAKDFFVGGGRWHIFSVADRFTSYGLVGVLIERVGVIEQFVMSCRIFGLGIEGAVLATVAQRAEADGVRLSAILLETERNAPCRGVYKSSGWCNSHDRWFAPDEPLAAEHVSISYD